MQRSGLLFLLLLTTSLATWATEAPVYSSFLGGAINGYDPVAYFTESKPVKGDKRHHLKYQGADWYFASAENRKLFQQEPQKYAPQYGGYCAWAVSNGYTASTDPDAWTVHEGKLFLNYSKSVQERWNQSRDENIAKADKNWPSVLN